MPLIRMTPVLLLVGVFAACRCGGELVLPEPPDDVGAKAAITSLDVSPPLAREGTALLILFSANVPVSVCGATVGGQAAHCQATGEKACRCEFTINPLVAEGSTPVVVSASDVSATGGVQVDRTPPVIDAAKLVIVRNPVGIADQVAGAAGATTDPGLAYAGQRVVQVNVYDVAAGGTPIATAVPGGEGAIVAIDVPGSLQSGPQDLWGAAVDAVGNEGARTLLGNSDHEGPAGDGANLVIARRDFTAPDGISGRAGAFRDASALAAIRVWDVPEGGSPIATATPARDGSFAELAVGTSTSSSKDVWVSALDKCGNEGPRTLAAVGRDVLGPVLDGSRMSFERHDSTAPDRVSGAAGSVRQTCFARLTLYADENAGNALGTANPNADGSFDPVVVGTAAVAPGRVWVAAESKCHDIPPRAEVAVGAEAASLFVDGAKLAFVRRPVGALDGLRGSAGAFSGACFRTVRLFDAAAGGQELGNAPMRADGGFAEIPIGTGTRSYGRVWAVGASKCGPVSEPVEAWEGRDVEGPVNADDSLLAFVRRPLGEQDGVVGKPAAFADVGNLSALVTARLFESNAPDAPLLAEGPMSPDGGFPELRLGTGTRSYAIVYVSVVDKAGVEGARFATGTGNSTSEPTGNGSRLTIVRHDLSRPDGVRGAAGAFTDDVCALREVHVWPAQYGGTLLASGSLAADGSFPELAIGTATESFPYVWVSAVNKCGVENATHVLALNGLDTTPPVIDATKVMLVDRDTGEPDGVVATAGAVSDATTPVRNVRILHPTTAITLADGILPDGTGGFPERALGELSLQRVYVVAMDKAGNTSEAVTTRALRYVSTLRGRTPYSSTGRARLYPYAADVDPRTLSPGFALVAGAEASAADSAAATAADAARAISSAIPETATIAPAWTTVPPPASRPVPAVGQVLTYMAASGRTILFGGSSSVNFWQRETWAFDGAWTLLTPAHMPGVRALSLATYDAERARMVVFGGSDGADKDETWEFDGTDWTLGTGARAAHRDSGGLAFDSLRGRSVMFGGQNGSTIIAETTAYDGTNWTTLHPATSPAWRAKNAMAYDAARDRMVMFGGVSNDAACDGTSIPGMCSGTWEFDGNTWKQVANNGPQPRFWPVMTYSPGRRRVLLYGGIGYNSAVLGDTWEWDGTSWTQLSPASPPTARYMTAMAWDAKRGRTVVYAGDNGAGGSAQYLGDTVELEARTAHARTAAQVFLFPLPNAGTLQAISTTWIGAGTGDASGAPGAGVALSSWSPLANAWTSLGANTALDTDAAAARTITGAPSAGLAEIAKGGRFWLLAASQRASSTSASGPASTVATDAVEVQTTWLLP